MPKDLAILETAQAFVTQPTFLKHQFDVDFPRSKVIFLSKGDSLVPSTSWWDDYSLLSGDLSRSLLGFAAREDKLIVLNTPKTAEERETFFKHIPVHFREYISGTMHQAGLSAAGASEIMFRAAPEQIQLMLCGNVRDAGELGRTQELRVSSDGRLFFFDRFFFSNIIKDPVTMENLHEGKAGSVLLSGVMTSEVKIDHEGNVTSEIIDYSLTPVDIDGCKILFSRENLKPLVDFIEPRLQPLFKDAPAQDEEPAARVAPQEEAANSGAGGGGSAEAEENEVDGWLVLETIRSFTPSFTTTQTRVATVAAVDEEPKPSAEQPSCASSQDAPAAGAGGGETPSTPKYTNNT